MMSSVLSNLIKSSYIKPWNLSVCAVQSANTHFVSRDPIYKKHNIGNDANFRTGKRSKNNKYSRLRAQKIEKVELPDFHKKEKSQFELTPEDLRAKYKERGLLPPRHWDERPMYIASTSGVFEPYVPPEGDGVASLISKEGARQKVARIVFKGKALNELRKIRQYEEDFDPKQFANEAQAIYEESYNALADDDKDRLHQAVTEFAYPKAVNQVENKQIRWSFIKNIEPPKVVHLRTTHVISKDNIFAQVTIRFHSQQTLAVYDRFGRLVHGSEVVSRDVLEYVVFEKHISNSYGVWRVHDKIIPDWMPPRQSSIPTYVVSEDDMKDEPEPEQKKDVAKSQEEPEAQPALAT